MCKRKFTLICSTLVSPSINSSYWYKVNPRFRLIWGLIGNLHQHTHWKEGCLLPGEISTVGLHLQGAVLSVSFVCVPCCAESLQACLTLCNPMECSPLGSFVLGVLQASLLEWVAISSSRNPTLVSRVSCIAGGFFTPEPLGKPASSSWNNAKMTLLATSFLNC